MRIGIVLALAGLTLVGGCGTGGTNVPPPATTQAKVQKPPYDIDLDTKVTKTKTTAGITLPGIRYTANSKSLERRASLVVRYQAPATKDGTQPAATWVILYPTDLPGTTGSLSSDYMDTADQQVAKLLAKYGAKGTVKVQMALVRSSIRPDANEDELNAKRLTEWVPTDVVVKGSHKKG